MLVDTADEHPALNIRASRIRPEFVRLRV